MSRNFTGGKVLNGELTREECDDEATCQFLLFLKRYDWLKVDKEDEMQEIQWRIVVIKEKM